MFLTPNRQAETSQNEAYTTALIVRAIDHTLWVNRSTQVHVAVGRNINRLRNDAKLTQEQLAEKAEIDRRSLQRIEAGQWNMTVDYLDRLRRCLKVSWTEVFRGID